MRILGAVFFLSLLAGKFNKFVKMLLTESKRKQQCTRIFCKFFGGKIKIFWIALEKKITRNNICLQVPDFMNLAALGRRNRRGDELHLYHTYFFCLDHMSFLVDPRWMHQRVCKRVKNRRYVNKCKMTLKIASSSKMIKVVARRNATR